MQTLTNRQQQLLSWLSSKRTASIAEIEEQFDVSAATAYREARALVNTGMALKISRGVRIVPPGELSSKEGKCDFCGGTINTRTAFIIQMQDGSQRSACCSHCGLMALGHPGVATALATDFLYGRMISARQATFLLESVVNLCCEPSVLCFASEEEACSFQKGFGGKMCTLDEAKTRLAEIMILNDKGERE
jgi:DeoR family transcriptional regulator, copper-sensing transcriptional repressor